MDLLIEKNGRLRAAVEIKSTGRVAGADLVGLRSFAAENPGVPRFVVTPAAEPHRLEKVLVTNWRDFLAQFEDWGEVVMHEPFDLDLMDRVWEGAALSRFFKYEYREILDDQGLSPGYGL